MKNHINIKLVVVGDACVGKTCILKSYAQQRFPTQYVPTVFENYNTNKKIGNKTINLSLWDTAGQEQYNNLRHLAYHDCDIFLIIFSVVDRKSFQNSLQIWHSQLQQKNPNTLKIFIGNKTDLKEQYSQKYGNKSIIEKQQVQSMIEERFGERIRYFECSALKRQGLDIIFEESIKQVLKKNQQVKTQKLSNQPQPCYANCLLI